MKKKCCIAFAVLFELIAVTGTSFLIHGISNVDTAQAEDIVSETSEEDKERAELEKSGKFLNKLLTADKDQTVVIKAKDFTVAQYELDILKQYFKMRNSKTPTQDAIDDAIRLKSLYCAATNEGYKVTKKEIDEQIETIKTSAENEPDSVIHAYLDEFDDPDVFWDYEWQVVHDTTVTNKYLNHYWKIYLKDNNISECDADTDLWDKFQEEIEAGLIESQDAKVIE